MIAHERLQTIISLLEKQQRMSVHALQTALDVSGATLRRDLSELEAGGRVVRVRGGVVHPSFFRGEPTFAQKKRTGGAQKRAMALCAAALVPDGCSVWVDAGTTCLEVGRLLLLRRDLTIWTHSLALAHLAQEGNCAARVLCCGGEVRGISGALVGAMAFSWVSHIRADWCFVGASGLAAQEGASTTEIGEAALKTAIVERATHKVLMADATKWQNPTTVNFAPWPAFDFWICDDRLSPRAAKTVEKLGPKVILASFGESP